MRIRNVVHKGLRRLFEKDDPRGVPPAAADKLRKMMFFLQEIGGTDELRDVPVWRAHLLTGGRKGTWALHVTRNWRLTFRIEADEVVDVNFEDYHQ